MSSSSRIRSRSTVAAVAALWFAGPAHAAPIDFVLPGTQPLGVAGVPASAQIQDVFIPAAGAFVGPPTCTGCHHSDPSSQARPMSPWQGSMMSLAARDPIFYAQLDLANHDSTVDPNVAGMGDLCLRCHSPVGWLEGRSSDVTGLSFQTKDLFGVQCHACHRLVNPQTVDPADLVNIVNGLSAPGAAGVPPTFGNGMYIMDRKQVRRGPYSKAQLVSLDGTPGFHSANVVGDGVDWTTVSFGDLHPVFNSPFHRSGNLCGTCHDVSNPTNCGASDKTHTQQCFPIERTWTEWWHSGYAAIGEAGNCQSCHMSGPLNSVGYGSPCDAGSSAHVNDVHFHDLTGGNRFAPAVIKDMRQRYNDCVMAGAGCSPAETNFKTAVEQLYPIGAAGANVFADLDAAAVTDIDAGMERVQRTLRRAADMTVTSVSPNLVVHVHNRTGHKLPTGYPEGRRMWLNVKFINAAGATIAQSGRYDPADGALYHDQNLLGDAGPKPYDRIGYTSAETSADFAGPGRPTKVWEARVDRASPHVEFHFALNNEVVMDNRIPPDGWNIAGYTADRAMPAIPAIYTTNGWQGDYGVSTATPVSYDDVSYPLPAGTDRVELTLFYQTASREYVEALAADNPGTLTAGGYNRGSILLEEWTRTGRSTPVVMAHLIKAVVDTDADELPDGWEAAEGLTVGPNDYNGDPDGDGFNNWQELQNGTHPTNAASHPGATLRNPVDIILVLDTSGSMADAAPGTTTPKIDVLKASVTLFLETWKDYAISGDRIGVVYFNSDAAAFPPNVMHNFLTDWAAVNADVNGKAAGGWTAMGAGMYRAFQGFSDPAPPAGPRARHVILFSNGMQNFSPMVINDVGLALHDQAVGGDVVGTSSVVLGSDFAFPADITVHTIGIGVAEHDGGTQWQQLLTDIAGATGKHNFITRASDLEGTFLEDLVSSLQGHTVEYVLDERRTLAASPEVVEIPVNPTATRFTALVTWEPGAPPPAIALTRPDGHDEELRMISRGGSFYRIITRYLGDLDTSPTDFGIWKLHIAAGRKGQDLERAVVVKPMPIQVHVLLDEADIHHHFLFPRRHLRIGETIEFTALATQRSRLLKRLDRVTVTVRSPTAHIGTLLAKSRAELKDEASVDPDLRASPFARKHLAVLRDPSFRSSIEEVESTYDLTDDARNGDAVAGDGVFTRRLAAPVIAGHYVVRFRMQGIDGGGRPFLREEVHSLFIDIGKIADSESMIRIVTADGKSFVQFEPRDADRHLLGPGYASGFSVKVAGNRLVVEDLLDGRYRTQLPAGATGSTPIVIGFGGYTVHDGPVSAASIWDNFSWWWLILFLLLIIVAVVILVVRRRTRGP